MITLTATAHCIRRACDWTAAGDLAAVDRAADKHTRTTRHPTGTLAAPAIASERPATEGRAALSTKG